MSRGASQYQISVGQLRRQEEIFEERLALTVAGDGGPADALEECLGRVLSAYDVLLRRLGCWPPIEIADSDPIVAFRAARGGLHQALAQLATASSLAVPACLDPIAAAVDDLSALFGIFGIDQNSQGQQ